MHTDNIQIALEDATLFGRLHLPASPKGIVIIAEGKDCKMLRVQHEHLFRELKKRNMATLFTYLLDPAENQDYDIPFDIELMSAHLKKVTRWISAQRSLERLAVGYFAANTAAAAAMLASIPAGSRVKAIVSHCGRPDLAGPLLSSIKPATLLITGSENIYLTELNWQAYALLSCKKELVTVEGNPGLFEMGRNARKIARLSADWFDHHLSILPGRHRNKALPDRHRDKAATYEGEN